MELKLGKMTNKELAEWMGISSNCFAKMKEKKYEELKVFAEYHFDGKKVVIDKILNPVYSKKGSDAYQKIKDRIDEVWSPTGLDSCKNVSTKIKAFYGDDLNVGDTTTYLYTTRGRNELYGKPFEAGGSLGSCTYMWCKKNDDGMLVPLTPEEETVKANLIKKYFGNADEKQIIVSGMVESGEIKKEEAWDILTELTNMKGENFMMFLGELQEKLDCKIVRGTMVTRNKDVAEIEEKSAF